MSIYLYIILAYLLVLTVLNFIRARRIKSQEQFMVAGRSLKWQVMVFTLICTWIGSGTFISGAEFASKAGFSALWLAAGRLGRDHPHLLPGRQDPHLRPVHGRRRPRGPLRPGGPALRGHRPHPVVHLHRLLPVRRRRLHPQRHHRRQDLRSRRGRSSPPPSSSSSRPSAAWSPSPTRTCRTASSSSWPACSRCPSSSRRRAACPAAKAALEPGYFAVVNSQFGAHPWLKAIGYFLSTMFLLLGVQSMYQKFYSAKSAKDAKKAVAWWTVGTIFVETIVVVIAVFAYSKLKGQIDLSIPKAGGKVVLMAAKQLVPVPVGVLLLGAACAVVISTGMNYLLSPSTTDHARHLPALPEEGRRPEEAGRPAEGPHRRHRRRGLPAGDPAQVASWR